MQHRIEVWSKCRKYGFDATVDYYFTPTSRDQDTPPDGGEAVVWNVMTDNGTDVTDELQKEFGDAELSNEYETEFEMEFSKEWKEQFKIEE
jgi:hypothetical protein